MNARILVVDDDTALAEMIGIVLRTEGFEPSFCDDGAAAVEAFRSVRPDLVLLDLMLPGMDGIAVCRLIRNESDVPIIMLTARTDTTDVVSGLEAGADDYVPKPFKPQELVARIREESGVPIIMLTAKSDTTDVVKGLESGADDYVVKPFNPKELVARIRTRLRPATESASGNLQVGDVTLDVAGHEVRRGSTKISLTPLEFELLLALALKPQQVFTREMLLEQVWGYHYKADTRLVNVHVQRLRAKVEKDPESPEIVITVRGIGYRAGEAAQ